MTESSGVMARLEKAFEARRLVIWHDPDAEFASSAEVDELPSVVTIRVANNEYAIKTRVLLDEPEQKFLIYRGGPVPDGIENWLLDLELAHGVFKATGSALLLDELGLSSDAAEEVVAAHPTFFRSQRRLEELKRRATNDDGARDLRAKMLAVLCGGGTDHRLVNVVTALLREYSEGERPSLAAIEAHGLTSFLIEGLDKVYGYASEGPSFDDFVLWFFRGADSRFQGLAQRQARDAQLDFLAIRDNYKFRDTYRVLATEVAAQLGVKNDVVKLSLEELLGRDVFRLIDQRILSELVDRVANRTMLPHEVERVVQERRTTFWYEDFADGYAAVLAASGLLTFVEHFDGQVASFDEGLVSYAEDWYRIDQSYRGYHLHAGRFQPAAVLAPLRQVVENFYTNKYLQVLGDAWQAQIDVTGNWRSNTVRSQARFYAEFVAPLTLGGRNKAVVVISDALRFEIADELRARIRQEDKYEAGITPLLGVLPSFTQLGMAALLPHTSLELTPEGTASVDGKSASGTENRAKILAAVKGTAIQASDLKTLSADGLRSLYRDHQVLYVFHNRIDAVGDSANTESDVFDAAEQTIQELVALVKRLTSANATNILLTADHGFLYQDTVLEKTMVLSSPPAGDAITYKKRRFVLGTGLKQDAGFRRFTPEQLGIGSQTEVLIPKSVQRVSVQGAGNRYVHGGASLQEIVVPVVAVTKRRVSDTRLVEAQIRPTSNLITNSRLTVPVFQIDPVDEKVHPRVLRAGLYAGDDLISNQIDVVFDRTSEDVRDRQFIVSVLLTADSNANEGQLVDFRLDERIGSTAQWKTYEQAVFTLKRAFATDSWD